MAGLLRAARGAATLQCGIAPGRCAGASERARARGGTLLGLLTGYLASLKGLPTGYSKDLQEDKRTLFSAEEAVAETLAVLTGTIATLGFLADRAAAAITPEMLAADIAELLAAGGVPFRSAHEAMGRLVQQAEAENRALSDFVGDRAAGVDPSLASIRPEWWDVKAALERRSIAGGSSPESVRNQIAEARSRLDG